MADKYQLASYCSSLLSMIESKEDAGQHRGGAIAIEYTKAYDELLTTVRKEHENEARTKSLKPIRPETRTDLSRGESGRSGPDRTGDVKREVDNSTLRRPGIQSPNDRDDYSSER